MKKMIASLLILAATNSMAIDLTVLPTATAIEAVKAAFLVTTIPTGVTSVYVGDAPNKEQLVAVKDDALDFLAGDVEPSEVLANTIVNIRDKAPDLSKYSDKEIASLIVSTLE